MSFDLWWVSEVGHPPADERERYAFEMARKAWVLMPVEFRQKLTAIQQMLTIADTQEKRLELSDRLIRLGRTVEPEVAVVPDETGEPCNLCKKPSAELCSDGTCRACHVSCSWEDCIDGTYNANILRRNGWTRERVLEIYPNARI